MSGRKDIGKKVKKANSKQGHKVRLKEKMTELLELPK